MVTMGDPWSVTYWFNSSEPDQNPDPTLGDYPAVVYFQLQVGPAAISGSLTPGVTLIRNSSMFAGYDAYDAMWPLSPIDATFLVQLRDFTQTAWTVAGLSPRDALPLCPDITLDAFSRRLMRVDGPPNPAQNWFIVGSVDVFNCLDCAPEPPMLVPTIQPKPAPQMPQRKEAPVRRFETGAARRP
jgi:hypothetical protein